MKSHGALLGLAFSILLAGCAAPINKAALTPTGTSMFAPTGKTIAVLPVTVRPQPELSMTDVIHSMPDSDTYRDVVITTIKNTGLFSDVKKGGESDYALAPVVLGERLIGSVNNIGLFLIRYELKDMATGGLIWRENIFSYSMLSASEVFAGHDRAPKVIEAGIRENMTQLAAKLGAVISDSAP